MTIRPNAQIPDQREIPDQPPENVATSHEVAIHFKGVFQCRLATDSDPSDHPRGKDGWTFAHTGEPDFDRIIRFNNPVSPRPCADKVEVLVTKVIMDGSEVADSLMGKQVNLGPNSFFDGAFNSPGTEPIANFEFNIGNPDRYVKGESTTPPKGEGVKTLDPATLSALGVDTEQNFRKWVRKRIKCLEAQPPSPAIDERIDQLLVWLPPISIRWQALQYFVKYPGTIDKNLQLNPMGSLAVQAMVDGGVTALDFEATFSSFDADGLVGRVEGLVKAAWTV
jgi:hypothetical protein